MSFNSHYLSTVDPMSKTLGFSESLEKFISNDVFQSEISSRPNLSFSGLGPWAIIHGTAKLENIFISRISTLMVPFERSLSKLSEKPKIFDFRSTELNL